MKLRMAAAGVGLASMAGLGIMASGAGTALADGTAQSLTVSCNAGHGAFGAFSQNPNSPAGYVANGQGNGAHAPGQGEAGPGFGQTHNDGRTGLDNSSYAASCNGG